MDYLESLQDPLKYYFKEKIGSLYINRNVMDLFINKGAKGEGQRLTDSFLQFSEITELRQNKQKNLSRRFLDSINFNRNRHSNFKDSGALFEVKKKKKQIDAMLRNRVSLQLAKEDMRKMDSQFARFRRNDKQVKELLDMQTSNLNSKLLERRQRSMIKSWVIRAAVWFEAAFVFDKSE